MGESKFLSVSDKNVDVRNFVESRSKDNVSRAHVEKS